MTRRPEDPKTRKPAIYVALLLCFIMLSSHPVALAAEGEKEADARRAEPLQKPSKDTAKKTDTDSWVIDGYARVGLRHRFTKEYSTEKESDRDVRGILSLDIKDREKAERFSFHLLGNFNWDMNGKVAADGYDPFRDVYDSYEGRLQGEVYSAYIKTTCPLTDAKLFLGRQSIYKGEALDFDGLRAEYRASKNLGLSLYGGVPANYHESSHREDSMAGGGAEVGIPRKISLRCDYIRIRDRKTYEPGEPLAKDDLVVICFKYTALKPFSLYALHSRLESRDRRSLVRAKWADKKRGFLAGVSFLRQNVTLTDYSTELSPFYIVLAEYAPYDQLKTYVLKDLSRHVRAGAGFGVRRLRDEDDEGFLNHSFGRYYATLHFVKLLDKKVDVSLTGEKWNASGRNDKSIVEGEVKVKLSPRLKLRIGTDFSLYKYDYSLQEEKENVSAYFVRTDYKMSDLAKLRFKCSLERDDREEYYLFDFSLILQW